MSLQPLPISQILFINLLYITLAPIMRGILYIWAIVRSCEFPVKSYEFMISNRINGITNIQAGSVK